jgi:N6-L-threonylcarbamoyladenine synthase
MQSAKSVIILGIESSCDETAASVLADGSKVLSSVVASQTELHSKYGGVVPEIASRAHIESIYPVVSQALKKAGVERDAIDAIAVANRPGLTIALMVGVTAAKALSFAWEKPLISIDHLHAHIQSAVLGNEDLELPAAALIVSGGHTSLYDYHSPLQPVLMGSTIDDAAGEAFDKVASILGLPYPGGPAIEKTAKDGYSNAIRFPRSLLNKDTLDFSFSGVKTAVLYHCRGQDMKGKNKIESMSKKERADIAASFQQAVVDVLVEKTKRAAEKINAKTILIGGGVAANTALREQMREMCESLTPPRKLLTAEKKYCTDNAVMIASLGWHKYKQGILEGLELEPVAYSK